ncbi:MAG: hypothetical protein WCT33_05340 [Patescibacteria group bacterium]
MKKDAFMPDENEVKPDNEVLSEPELSAPPKIDTDFGQKMGQIWGDVMRNFTPEDTERTPELNDFFTDLQGKFRQLSSERRVAQVHQFDELEEFADGLPMLAGFMGRAYGNERSGYDNFPEDMRDEIQAKDQRNKKLFIDTSHKLFPDIQPPESFADANKELQNLAVKADDSPESAVFRSALELFKDDSIVLKRKTEILDDLIAQIGDMQLTGANYGQFDSPFGASNKQEAISAARLVYQLSLIRDQFQKELYGREDISGADAKKIDDIRSKIQGDGDQNQSETSRSSGSGGMTEEEVRAAQERVAQMNIVGSKRQEDSPGKKPTPLEESEELAGTSLSSRKIDLGKNGVMSDLYDSKFKTVEDIKRIVTPEMKRTLLENMLQDVDHSIRQVNTLIMRGDPDLYLNRRNVSQFCGQGVTVGEGSAVYQKIAVASEGRIINPNEVALMPMVDYLRKYLGYDLTKDKQRAEILREHTNAFE